MKALFNGAGKSESTQDHGWAPLHYSQHVKHHTVLNKKVKSAKCGETLILTKVTTLL